MCACVPRGASALGRFAGGYGRCGGGGGGGGGGGRPRGRGGRGGRGGGRRGRRGGRRRCGSVSCGARAFSMCLTQHPRMETTTTIKKQTNKSLDSETELCFPPSVRPRFLPRHEGFGDGVGDFVVEEFVGETERAGVCRSKRKGFGHCWIVHFLFNIRAVLSYWSSDFLLQTTSIMLTLTVFLRKPRLP